MAALPKEGFCHLAESEAILQRFEVTAEHFRPFGQNPQKPPGSGRRSLARWVEAPLERLLKSGCRVDEGPQSEPFSGR